jgi:hypothetical protein
MKVKSGPVPPAGKQEACFPDTLIKKAEEESGGFVSEPIKNQ